jgi:cell division septal protein FtsQ
MIKEASQKMEGLPGPRKKKKNRVLIWIIFLVLIVALIMISFMVLPRINGISIRF